MIFEAKISEAFLVKKVFESICDLVPSINWEIGKEGINCRAMDDSRNSLVALRLPKEFFETYTCKEVTKISIDSKKLHNVLKLAENDDSVEIKIASNNADKIHITFYNERTGDSMKTSTRLLSESEEEIPEPNLTHTTVCNIESAIFKRRVAEFSQFDTIRIIANRNGVTMSGEDTYQAFERYLSPPTENRRRSMSVEVVKPVDKSFGYRFMHAFTKTNGIAENVKIKLSEESICVEYAVGEDGGFLRFFVAPRIEVDDEME